MPTPQSDAGSAGIARARRRGLLGKFGGRGGVRRRAGMQFRGARGLRGVGGLACHWPRGPRKKSFFMLERRLRYTGRSALHWSNY